jgi:ABC-2 type transport system ATP-binding protein
VIRIESLRKVYRTGFLMRPKVALQGIDLRVEPGEVFGFIGPNGAGKSTTIKILTGLLRPSSGVVELLGGSPDDPRRRARMGYLPEHPYFYDYLSGWELLRFYGGVSGLRGKLLTERMEWALELVHANADWIHRRLRTYSKGMMQRVGLAQAVLSRPELLILDEPMSGLDPLGRRDVREAILALNKAGTTVFYSSHVLADVEQISHRVAMVVDGRIVRAGTVAAVTADDSAQFRVHTATALTEFPDGVRPGELPCSYLCVDGMARDRLLSACLRAGAGVLRLESSRPSLEDILAREVTHAEP